MADRTSAGLFALMFESIASGRPLDATVLWSMMRDYDFSYYQMGCDDALKKLGLLWVCSCGKFNYGPPKETPRCEDCEADRPS